MVVGGRELIDTLWNVNHFVLKTYCVVPGINRYIMECKYLLSNFYCLLLIELIDTLWNVNFLTGNIFNCFWIELIDTLWNVNFPVGDVQRDAVLQN